MNGLIIIMLFAAVPLVLLIENIALSEPFKNRHARHAVKKITAGALKGFAQGVMFR